MKMFVTGSNELKFSHWPDVGPQECYNMSIESDVQCMSWSKNNAFLIYLEKNGRPEILSLKQGKSVKPIHIITAIDHATYALFSRNRTKLIAIGTGLSTVALYDTRSKTIGKLYDMPGPVVAMDFNVYDTHLAIVCDSGKIVVLNLTNSVKVNLYDIKQPPSLLRFHPLFEDVFGICTKDGRFYLFDINEGKPLWKLVVATSNKVNGFAFSPKLDRKEMITVDEECKFCVYEMTNGRCSYRCCLQHPLTAVDYSHDGKHFAIGMEDGTVCIFAARNPRSPAYVVNMHSSRIHCLYFANDYRATALSDTSSQLSCASASVSPSVSCIGKRVRSIASDIQPVEAKAITWGQDNDAVTTLKADMIADLSKSAMQLNAHMNLHMTNLQDFIRKEFDKIEVQMDEKWNLMNVVRASCKLDDMETSDMFDDIDNPITME